MCPLANDTASFHREASQTQRSSNLDTPFQNQALLRLNFGWEPRKAVLLEHAARTINNDVVVMTMRYTDAMDLVTVIFLEDYCSVEFATLIFL